MEEGTHVDLTGQRLGLVVGEPAEFRFLGSSVRKKDRAGELIEDWGEEIEELAPVETTLPAEAGAAGQTVPVKLRADVTAVGTLELWCVADDDRRWKLEYNVRERPE
jgi:hypothetical protein